MEKLLKTSVIYCCLAATSRKCKITLYGCHSPSQHRKPSLNFDAVALYRRGLRVVCSSIKGDAKASRCGTATVDFRAFLSVEPQGATGNTKQTNGNNNFDSDSKFVQQWANHPRGNG